MKIRRITVIVLIVLSLMMFIDIRYNLFARLKNVQRTPVQYQVGSGGLEPTFSGTHEFRQPKGNLTAINIENQFGTVIIRRADHEEIVVIATVKAFDPSVEEADKNIRGWEPQEQIRGSEIFYEWIAPASERKEVQTDFTIEVPQGMAVRVEQAFGTVQALDLSGNMGIDTDFSTVLIQDFVGYLKIKSSYSTLNLRNIEGALTVDDSFSTLVGSLIKSEAGYNFDVGLSFGTLRGNVPYTLKEKDMHDLKAKGSWGQGLHPVKIRSSFGTIDLSLAD